MSRIHGTRRIHEVTGGHEEDPIRVQEEPRGHHRTRGDTPLRRFGTVRPRVQIPGPRLSQTRGSLFKLVSTNSTIERPTPPCDIAGTSDRTATRERTSIQIPAATNQGAASTSGPAAPVTPATSASAVTPPNTHSQRGMALCCQPAQLIVRMHAAARRSKGPRASKGGGLGFVPNDQLAHVEKAACHSMSG